jgi:hypothetical protein
MNYLDFDLLIERSGEKYKARVLNCPAGQATIEFSPPFSELELDNFLLKIGRPRRSGRSVGSPEVETTKAFGERLFKAIFDGAVYGCFHSSLDEVKRQQAGLRLRLRLADVPELANVPWEYLYYNSAFDRFLCLSSETPIVRYLDLPERIRPLAVKPPIRILVMISSPTNYPKLEVEQEWANLNQALDDLKRRGLVTLEKLEKANLTALQKQLRLADYHIFHYIGHGGFDSQSHDGVLIMEDEHNFGHAVSGRNLGTILYDERTLRLVLLNACEGARGSITEPFAGTAQSLVRQGIPAVIAMQFEVTDQAAITLAHEFYDALADGYPLDAALAEARKAIFAQGNNVEWGTPVLYMRSPDGRIFDIETIKRRVFISYKRKAEPDQSFAIEIYNVLRQMHEVFIDQTMLVGSQWVAHIMEELHRTDFLITLLSERSVNSEMVQEEIRIAHNLAEHQRGSPVILPVRLAYSEPFPYPLSEYLNSIHWAFWQGPEDTPRLIGELKRATAGSVLPIGDEEAKAKIIRPSPLQQLPPPFIQAQPVIPAKIESPEGTMDPQSKYYVERPGDWVARSAIQRQGETITIKAPRQMGKSSLLLRIMEQATKMNKRVVFFDFQQFDKSALRQADSFFRQFCSWLTYKLIMQDRVDTYWKIPLGNIQRCTSYVEEYVLKELNDRLVLAMDEVETLFDTDFRSDFFGMLRSWHNSRREGSIWKKLDLVLVTSTEPYQFVDNLNQSPFNVGEVIALTDFTLEHIADLNRRHGSPLTPQEEQHLLHLLGGQPYLVRRALYLVASKRMTAAELFAHATDDRGPFGDHLRNHLFRLHGRKELIEGLLQVIHQGTCQDDHVFFRLYGAGLVRKGESRAVLPRCQLYADYFREQLHG